MFNYSNSHRKENKSPLKREHILQLEALEERALLSALPWNTDAADAVPAIVAPAAVQNNVIISPLTLEVPQALESDPGVVSEGIYTFNEIDYNAHEIECLQTFFEQTDDNEVTNGVNLFGESYDVNDPASWFNNENKGATFTNVDGVQRLTALNLENGSNLVGDLDISDCTELATLSLSGLSNLTSLNMSGCTSITGKLDIYQLGLMSLTALDVSGCTSLESLFAYVHGSLVTLNASGCTSLDYLGAYEDANLVSVDVSGCTALTGLDCLANPNMTELKMSGCTAIQTMSCSNTLLTSLNVSECTELVQLECNGTQLTVLDLSECAALEYLVCWNANLECVIINPDLEYLYIELYDENYDTTWTFQDANETILSTESTYYEYSAENVSELPVTATSADETQMVRIIRKVPVATPTLAAVATSTNAVLVTVSEVEDASGYTLEYSANADFTDAVSQNVSAGTTTITGLNPEESPLYFRVMALTEDVTLLNSDFSDAQSVVFYDADEVAKLSTFFEQTDDDQVTNGTKLFGETYDANVPATWHNDDNKGATFTNVDGVMRLTALNLENGNLVGDLDVSGCTALVEVLAGHIDGLTSVNVSGCTALTGMETWSDGNLTSVDASGCTALDTLSCCDDPNLTSMDITGCNALTNLACYNTSLTELDVSGRTGLTDLYFDNCPLTSLNISGCTELYWLDLTGMSALTTLNLSGCTSLDYLDASVTEELVTLDASGCTALATLEISGLSKLTTLNISGCTAMTGTLNVRSLTALTTLNMSGCTAITRVNASNLVALTTLNASGCTSLTNLSAFNDSQLTSLDASGCTALKNLDCHECQLTSLTVSGCTVLEELTCQTNQLTSLDVSDCTALTYLECADNQLTSLDVSGCTELGELICQGNQFTKLDVSECTELSDLSCWTANLDCILISQEQTGLSIDLDEWKGNDRKWTFQTANGTVTTGNIYTYQNTDMLPVVATNADETQTVAIAVETTPLAAPTMSEGTVEMSKVSFTWDAVPNANGYQFEYKAVGSEEWLTKTVNKTSASFVGELGVEYTARVMAIGKGLYTDSEYSNEQAVPQLEIVATLNAKKVTVSWLDESPAADSIRYRVAGTEKWTTKKLKAGITSYTFNGKVGTNYEVQVLRDQQEGNILQGPVVVLDRAKLKADKAQIHYDSFQVNVTNYTAKNLADNVTQAILTVNGVQATVDIENQYGETTLEDGGIITFENGLFTFSEMASNTQYKVQVSFTDDVSVSTASSKLSVKTLKASYEAPVITSATALTDTSIEVTWETSYGQKTNTPAQKYTVQYSLDGNKWSNATTGATGNSYTIQKLKGGNVYKVRVLATKDKAFNASEASDKLEAETFATPKMALVKGSLTSNSFQTNVTNYADTNLTKATKLNVKSDQFGDVVIIVVNGAGSETFGNGMTVAFENGTLTFENAPANTKQKIQISFTDDVCTTAWSSALSVKTAKAA